MNKNIKTVNLKYQTKNFTNENQHEYIVYVDQNEKIIEMINPTYNIKASISDHYKNESIKTLIKDIETYHNYIKKSMKYS
jgi:hypothetical protein